jgi:hypothetical protein
MTDLLSTLVHPLMRGRIALLRCIVSRRSPFAAAVPPLNSAVVPAFATLVIPFLVAAPAVVVVVPAVVVPAVAPVPAPTPVTVIVPITVTVVPKGLLAPTARHRPAIFRGLAHPFLYILFSPSSSAVTRRHTFCRLTNLLNADRRPSSSSGCHSASFSIAGTASSNGAFRSSGSGIFLSAYRRSSCRWRCLRSTRRRSSSCFWTASSRSYRQSLRERRGCMESEGLTA